MLKAKERDLTARSAQGRFFPLNNYHSYLMAAALDPETTTDFHVKNILRWGARITPGLHERSLQRAFVKLVKRHEMLRARFVEQGGDWQIEIMPDHPKGLQVKDISALSKEDQDAHVLQHALEPMTVLSFPMFEMVLFKGGSHGDVLMARAQHAIVDGYSSLILIEEVLKLILKLPLGPTPPTYDAYIRRNLQQCEENKDQKEAFWRDHLLPPPHKLNIGRIARGMPAAGWKTTSKSICIENLLSAEQAKAMEARAKASGINIFAYFHAAYCETLCAMAGQTEVVVNSVTGRSDPAMQGFVCPDQQPLGIKYICDPGHLEERAQWVAGLIKQMLAASPTYALLPEGPLLGELTTRGDAWFRFLAYVPMPMGRMRSSPFSKFFEMGMQGKASFGPFTFESMPLRGDAEIDCEIQLSMTRLQGMHNVTIHVDAAVYDEGDLLEIADGIRSRLFEMEKSTLIPSDI